jgi:4-hydroxy-tetrahydrodipicolinate synthase
MMTPLCGIIPPMVTPLCDRDTLDVSGLECLIEHILDGGVHGLFILGTTGEAPSLSYALRRELIDRTCRQVGRRVPVLVGITDTSFVESLSLGCFAAEAGAEALVLAAPYYFPAGQPELVEYVEHLAAELPLPTFLYNMPAMTKVSFAPSTIQRLLTCERIVGVKDSSGDMNYFEQLIPIAQQRRDWSVLMGPEHLLPEAVQHGGQGGVNGGANLCPRLFVDLYEAARLGDKVRVCQLKEEVQKLGRIYTVGHHASSIIKGLKCALSLLGICDDFLAEPFHRFHSPERDRVRELLDDLNPA